MSAVSWRPVEQAESRRTPRERTQRAPRFLVDESLGSDAARLLRDRDWNAKCVEELGLRGKADEAVFAAAWKQRRVILTHDRDFLDNRRFPPNRNPGVVVFVVGASGEDDRRLLRAFTFMQWLVGAFGGVFMRGTKIVFSDDEHVTIERRNRTGTLETSRYWVPANSPAMICVEG
jgi:predicted nuclease of predicted toxin-antitoxin system